MSTTSCPHCGGEVEVPTRAKMGSGTVRAKGMKLNINRKAILDAMKEHGKPMSVRDVQAFLVNRNIRRISGRGAGWNYHTVQADLSILVGMELVAMNRPLPKEVFDPKEGFTTDRVPTYELKGETLA